ncbi:MAG: ABC transporter ATP-binding protein [Magnetospiraceae bacterium]
MDVKIQAKAYGTGAPVLGPLQFTLRDRAFAVLFGPSGCGKSTLLNIIAGLDPAFDGAVSGVSGAVGYVFQEPRLLPWLSVADNLRVVLDDPAPAEHRIETLLREMELWEDRGKFANRLSLGMARRVALARALVVEPSLLLMDEPFVSLDEPTAVRLRLLLRRVVDRLGLRCLFVTHNIHEAVQLADRILFIAGAPAGLVADVPVTLPTDRRSGDDVANFVKTVLAQEPSVRPLLT